MRAIMHGFAEGRWFKAIAAVALVIGSTTTFATGQDKPSAPARRPAIRRPNPTPPATTPREQQPQPDKEVKPVPSEPNEQPHQTVPKPAQSVRPNAEPQAQPQPQPQPAQPTPAGQSGQPVGVDEAGRVKLDPELQKKIDQMLMEDVNRAQGGQVHDPGASAAQPPTNVQQPTGAPRAAERRRVTPPAGQPGGVQPPQPQPQPHPSQPTGEMMMQPTETGGMATEEKGPSLEIEIPPEPDVAVAPPEARSYSFSIKNGTYEQLIKGFARQTGLGVLGEAPREGTVTFETTETLSFREALSRVRMLLFNYKPHEPYWILYEGSHLLVIRVTDLYRILDKSHMYRSVEEFRAADPPDDEIVLVIYTPKSGSIADLRQVRDFLPDYVRVTPLETGNSVSIFALVKDIKKYMELIEFFPTGGEDPRAIERFDVQFISATEAVNRLRMLADLDGAGRAAVPTARRGGTAQVSALEGIPAPAVSLIPDDGQGYFLVRAMKDKIEEIRRLLPYVDVEIPAGDYKPAVIAVHHADAAELVTAIQQVLSASSAAAIAPPAPTPRPRGVAGRGRRAAGGTSAPVSADSVTMIPHPAKNAIVVLGDEAGVNKVRELVGLFDVVSQVGPLRIQLEVADANEVSGAVSQILGSGPAKAQPGGERFQLVPDPSGTALWYSGSENDLQKVKEVIALLDVAQDPVSLRVVRLTYQLPSFVAGLLRELDGSTAASPAPAAAGRTPKSRRVTTQAASKFTPDDVQKLLYILCTEADWKRYDAFIAQIDVAAPASEAFTRLTVRHVDPATAIDRLGSMLGSLAAVDSSIRTVATDDSILVIGATPTDIDRIKVFLAEVDKPSTIEQRTFEIKHADPSDIKAAIEALLGDGGSPMEPRAAGRRRGVRGVEGAGAAGGGVTAEVAVSEKMTILQMGHRLVVKATPQRLDEVAALIAEFDVPTTGTDLKVFADFPPGSDIVGISETLTSVFAGATRSGRRMGRDGASAVVGGEGPRFIPQPASSRLVVIGDPSQFAEIEKLLNVLRVEASAEPSIVEFIDVQHANPAELVEDIKPLLDMKIRGLVQSGELAESPVESTAPSPVPNPRRMRALQQGSSGDRYHIAPDGRNERIVIAAPKAIIQEARRLVEMFDQPPQKKDNVVFRTVELANGTPSEIIKSVRELMGRSSPPARTAVRPRAIGAGGAPAVPGAAGATESLSTETLTMVEAPGGGSIILNGVAAEVEKATEWIHRLDALSTRGRRIKLYQVKEADTSQMFDLIVNVVDSAAPAKAGGTGRPARTGALPGKGSSSDEEDEEFTTTRTHSGGDLYIQADLIGKTLLVATSAAKLAQIDDLVKMFETDEELAGVTRKAPVPKFTYKLEHTLAGDIRYDLEDYLKATWDPPDQLPKVEKLSKTTLLVRYPDASRFDEIREIIREHIDLPSDKPPKVLRKSIASPGGMSAEATARWLQRNLAGYDVELVNKTPEDIEKKLPIERVRPPAVEESKASPCVVPLAFDRMAQAVFASATGQQEPPPDESEPVHEEEVEPIAHEEPVFEQPYIPPPVNSDTMIRRALQPIAAPPSEPSKSDKKDGERSERERKEKPSTSRKLNVYYDDTQGVIVVEGEKDDLDTVKDSMKQLEEEIKDLLVAPDIRIYRVKYIDVFTAQDVLEEMFNATKSQQAQFAVQQQQMQQAMRMQQMQQQQQQQQQRMQQERGNQGQDGKDGRGQQQPQQAQQPQFQMPQLPAPAVRVYPNPRDRTLILRAETSQYPQILELLATIDQPKPVDSVMRTYQLKKLNATEVEQMLREMLRLDAGKDRPRAAARTPAIPGMPMAAQPSSTGPGGQLPQTVLQESTTGSLLGVDPQDITLFSSETANTIMAMAPPAALDYIGRLIDQFESGDIAERLTRYYALKHAAAGEVASQLTDYFAEKSPGRKSGGARRGGAESAPSGAMGGGLNAPSFIAYDRLNMLTVQATAEQIKEIEEVLSRLDVKSDEDEWKDVVLAHADAKMVADTLTEMFGGGGGGAVARGATGGAAGSRPAAGGKSPKFIGEPGGRIVLYSAPQSLHEQILATVAKLEAQSKQTATPRIIELKNATPSQVADAIEKAYDSKRTGARGASGSSSPPRFTVTAHDPSRRLFVVADDEMFAQVESLAKTLDTPGSSGLAVEFRIYPLQYANAKAVHGQMTKLMTEYIQRLGPQEAKNIEAFSVQPEETANALIVLGTPSVFGFIEENLRKIDTPASAVTKQEVRVVEVKNADPDAMVRALTEIFVRTAPKGPDGDIPISISAAAGSKAILVRSNAVDFAKIEATIKELDTQEVAAAGDVRVVTLQYGDASEVNTALQAYLKKPAGPGGGRGDQLIGDVRLGVLAQTNAIMVSGDQEHLDRIEAIIHGMDIAGEKGSVPQIIPLKYAMSSLVLPALKDMFSDPKFGGGKKNYAPPVIVADDSSNAIIVRASPTDLAAIQGVIDKIDTEDKKDKSAFRIVQVAPGINVEDLADKVEHSINESAKLRAGGTAGRGGPASSILATADRRTNSITIAGSPMLFDEAERMIRALEKMGPSGNKVTTIVPVPHIATDDIQRLIEQMTQQQSGGSRRGTTGGGSRSSRGGGSRQP